MTDCPSCSHGNRDGITFCTRCGTDLRRSCGSCGAPAESGDLFCGSCGQRLVAPSPNVNLPVEADVSGERRELEAEVARLTDEVAEAELDLGTLSAELRRFEARYRQAVIPSYAELDRLWAEIAELRAEQDPDDMDAAAAYQQAKAQAEDTAAAEEGLEETVDAPPPSEPLRRLYRDMARKVHPDLGADDADRERRGTFMRAINAAFDAGDEDAIRDIMADWEDSTEPATGVEQLRRKAERLTRRLEAIREEMASIRASDLWQLKERVEADEERGRDLLGDLKTAIEQEIELAKEELESLR